MKPRMYLCGGINGLNDSAAKDWRADATAQLGDLFEIIDPMRRDYRGKEAQNVAEIVKGDLEDIAACRYILVNAERPSWGTAMEVAFADARLSNRVIVAVCSAESPSPWLVYHVTIVVKTFAEAYSYFSACAPARDPQH